jgi:hypothetical protein
VVELTIARIRHSDGAAADGRVPKGTGRQSDHARGSSLNAAPAEKPFLPPELDGKAEGAAVIEGVGDLAEIRG